MFQNLENESEGFTNWLTKFSNRVGLAFFHNHHVPRDRTYISDALYGSEIASLRQSPLRYQQISSFGVTRAMDLVPLHAKSVQPIIYLS